jgi:uncharacterized protein YrzB (UPF0473 family)
MSKQQDYLEEQTITLDGQDGQTYTCKILCVFEHENKEYALLQNMSEVGSEEKADDSPVIMQLVQENDQAVFRVIEDDQEFDRVVEYIKQLANEIQEDVGTENSPE